jgi:transposase
MAIIGGFDLHRQQITFEYVDTDSGELRTGQIRPAARESLREWLAERFSGRGDVAFAMEGCTGWRFVVEELQRAGVEAHLAEPADTAAKRGPKKRAKTDKADAHLLRELLCKQDLPESWIAPDCVLEARTLARLYMALMQDRRSWLQRIHAQLYHQGVPPIAGLLTAEGRAAVSAALLSPAGREMVEVALKAIEALDVQTDPLRAKLKAIGRQQPGAQALIAHYGIGPLCAAIIWAELGDCRRFRRSQQAVRFAGLDITVWSTDTKRAPGYLSRQGSPVLRWALYEAAVRASQGRSPDHNFYTMLRERHDAKDAALSVARKLVRRCYHTLRELGDEAWLPLLQPTGKAA